MISKKTKIGLGLVSLFSILAFFPPSTLAASYNHSFDLDGYRGSFDWECNLEIFLEVTTSGSSITDYDGDWDFDTDKHWIVWPVWYWKWKFGSRTITYTLYYENSVLKAVKYTVQGKIYDSADTSKSIWISMWIKVDASGVKNAGYDIWNDNAGLYFLKL